MRSMTGYGKGEAEENGRSVTVELKTVNHKFFDWNTKMPKGFLFAEDEAKKAVAREVARGHVDVYITVRQTEAQAAEYRADIALASKYVAAAKELSEAVGVPFDIGALALAKNPDILALETVEADDEELRSLLMVALSDALKGLVVMRENEGEALRRDITEKLNSMSASVKKVAELAPAVVEEYRKKLTARITELLGSAVADMSKVATEVALFADKCAVDEEISRLKAHIAAMRGYLEADGPIGRKLDFLVQEMNREANTIGSKANDLDITREVLSLKNDIEKIREQAQNVE